MMDKKSLYDVLADCRKYSLLGWIRFFHLKLRRKKVVIEGNCLMCGRCCRRICLEANGRWLRKEKEFYRVVEKHPEYSRFTVVGRDSQGFLLFSCSWFTTAGICKDHENRLPICRNFPDTNLYFTGGEVPVKCGYLFREITSFATVLKKELDILDEKKKKNTGN